MCHYTIIYEFCAKKACTKIVSVSNDGRVSIQPCPKADLRTLNRPHPICDGKPLDDSDREHPIPRYKRNNSDKMCGDHGGHTWVKPPTPYEYSQIAVVLEEDELEDTEELDYVWVDREMDGRSNKRDKRRV